MVAAAWPPYQAPEADHALQEALHLAAAGLEVHVLTTGGRETVAPAGLHLHPITRWQWADLPRVWRLIGEILPHGALIFFLGHLYDYSTMALFLPTIVKLRTHGARVITQFSALGAGAPEGDALRLRLRRWAFRRLGRFRYGTLLVHSNRLLVMSEEQVRRIEEIQPALRSRTELAPPPPLFTVVNASPANRSLGRRRLGVPDDAFVFVYFSRLYPTKGIEELLEAFARFRAGRSGVHLAMVGGYHSTDAWMMANDYPEQLARLEADLGLVGHVVWSGEYAWDSSAPSEYLRAADVAVLPFDRGVRLNNSSFAAVTAHALPPIVALPPEGLEGGMSHGENVFGVPARDVGALTEALVRLYEDAELRQRLAGGAAELGRRWFSWESCTGAIRRGLRV